MPRLSTEDKELAFERRRKPRLFGLGVSRLSGNRRKTNVKSSSINCNSSGRTKQVDQRFVRDNDTIDEMYIFADEDNGSNSSPPPRGDRQFPIEDSLRCKIIVEQTRSYSPTSVTDILPGRHEPTGIMIMPELDQHNPSEQINEQNATPVEVPTYGEDCTVRAEYHKPISAIPKNDIETVTEEISNEFSKFELPSAASPEAHKPTEARKSTPHPTFRDELVGAIERSTREFNTILEKWSTVSPAPACSAPSWNCNGGDASGEIGNVVKRTLDTTGKYVCSPLEALRGQVGTGEALPVDPDKPTSGDEKWAMLVDHLERVRHAVEETKCSGDSEGIRELELEIQFLARAQERNTEGVPPPEPGSETSSAANATSGSIPYQDVYSLMGRLQRVVLNVRKDVENATKSAQKAFTCSMLAPRTWMTWNDAPAAEIPKSESDFHGLGTPTENYFEPHYHNHIPDELRSGPSLFDLHPRPGIVRSADI